jgi:hypothetical protein
VAADVKRRQHIFKEDKRRYRYQYDANCKGPVQGWKKELFQQVNQYIAILSLVSVWEPRLAPANLNPKTLYLKIGPKAMRFYGKSPISNSRVVSSMVSREGRAKNIKSWKSKLNKEKAKTSWSAGPRPNWTLVILKGLHPYLSDLMNTI